MKGQEFAADWKRGRGATCHRQKASEVGGAEGALRAKFVRQRRRRAFGLRCVVRCDAAACAFSPPLACVFSSAATEQEISPRHKLRHVML